MSDLGSLQFSPKCPKCGGNLGVEVSDGQPRGDDEVICQSCGFVLGPRSEVSKKIIAENRSEIERAAADKVREVLRKAIGQ